MKLAALIVSSVICNIGNFILCVRVVVNMYFCILDSGALLDESGSILLSLPEAGIALICWPFYFGPSFHQTS
jgi:hypothetical protein